MNVDDEVGLLLLLCGFEAVVNHPCCLACAVVELMARRSTPDRQPYFAAVSRVGGSWQVVCGSYRGCAPASREMVDGCVRAALADHAQ